MNGHPYVDALVTILALIIGVASLSVILSPKAKTTGVIQATASGFVNSLATAMSPVTGEHVNIRSDYPNSGGDGFMSFQGGFDIPRLY